MKIAIDSNTKLAYYKGDLKMKEYLHGSDFIDTRMTPDNCELIDISNMHIPHWLGGGKLIYNGTSFDLTAEGEAEILLNLQKAKRQHIKDKRDEYLNGSCTLTISGIEYELDCDLTSRSSIHQSIDNAELAGMAGTDTISWKLSDNSYHDFTVDELKMVAIQMAMFIQAQYDKERDKSLEISAATLDTIDEVKEI